MMPLRRLQHCGHQVSAGIVIEVYFLCKFIQARKRLPYSEFTGNLFLGQPEAIVGSEQISNQWEMSAPHCQPNMSALFLLFRRSL